MHHSFSSGTIKPTKTQGLFKLHTFSNILFVWDVSHMAIIIPFQQVFQPTPDALAPCHAVLFIYTFLFFTGVNSVEIQLNHFIYPEKYKKNSTKMS